MMQHGQFREDLYYRLNVITIDLPPLRQRLDDIPLLVKRFMERVNEQNHTQITTMGSEVLEALQQYHWPGNVRELLNVVEGMMVLAEKPTLEVDDLPPMIRQGSGGRPRIDGAPSHWPEHGPESGPIQHPTTPSPAVSGEALEYALSHMKLEDLEKQAIAATLRRLKNNRTHAARALGISVRTLQRKLGAKHSHTEDGEAGAEAGESDAVPAGEPMASGVGSG